MTEDDLTGQRFGVFHGLLIYDFTSSPLTHSNTNDVLLKVDDHLLLFKLTVNDYQK